MYQMLNPSFFQAMHFEHGGRCAICGDGYEEEDRHHEVPGKYATGIIGRSYFEPGQVRQVRSFWHVLK